VCRMAPDKPIGGTCDRAKVQPVGQRETVGLPKSPRRKLKLGADRPDFNRFFGAKAKDEQDGKFGVHWEPERMDAEMFGPPVRMFLLRALEYCGRPRVVGQQPQSGRSTAPARPSMAISASPSIKLGRGRLPAPDKAPPM
jgi:hypothetical protein